MFLVFKQVGKEIFIDAFIVMLIKNFH